MKIKPIYEISIHIKYKEKQKTLQVGLCDIFYIDKNKISFSNLREYISIKKHDLNKHPVVISYIEDAGKFYDTILEVIRSSRGNINFNNNYNGYIDNHGILIENKTRAVEIFKREVKKIEF